MSIQLQGNGGTVAEVDGTTFRAIRTTPRPTEYGALGHYKISATTGSMAAALGASSEIFQFRWTDATRFAVIQEIILDGIFASTAFAAGQILIRATVARSWSVDGSGGTAFTLTGNNGKQRTSMGSSLAVARLATTAALTAGTKSLDTQDLGQTNCHSAQFGIATPVIGWAGPATGPGVYLYSPDTAGGEHPLVFAQNEGLVIRATVPGTGVWVAGVTIRWAEVAAF